MHLIEAHPHRCAHKQVQLPSGTTATASVGTAQNDLQVLMLSMSGYTPVQLVGVPGPGGGLQGGWDHGGPGRAAALGGGAAGQCLPCALLVSPHGTGPVPVAASPARSHPLSGSCLEVAVWLNCMENTRTQDHLIQAGGAIIVN